MQFANYSATKGGETLITQHQATAAQTSPERTSRPDTMTYVTALLPVAQGVGDYAALNSRANTATVPAPLSLAQVEELLPG